MRKHTTHHDDCGCLTKHYEDRYFEKGKYCIFNHADGPRLIEWINTPKKKRKPAMLAFTAGTERNVAYAIERMER